jgi:uncharacterized protein YbjT (DUF2867 family)
MNDLPLVLVIGGTGAQGVPVVKGKPLLLSRCASNSDSTSALVESNRYAVRVLTRNANSARAKALSALPNVSFVEGSQDNQSDLHRAFDGAYGAWVNLDGFT